MTLSIFWIQESNVTLNLIVVIIIIGTSWYSANYLLSCTFTSNENSKNKLLFNVDLIKNCTYCSVIICTYVNKARFMAFCLSFLSNDMKLGAASQFPETR